LRKAFLLPSWVRCLNSYLPKRLAKIDDFTNTFIRVDAPAACV
jgi:hypothetical protein